MLCHNKKLWSYCVLLRKLLKTGFGLYACFVICRPKDSPKAAARHYRPTLPG